MAVVAPGSSAARRASVAEDKTFAYLVVKQDDGLDLATRDLLTASMHTARDLNDAGQDRRYGRAGSEGRWMRRARIKPEAGVWAAGRGPLRTRQRPY